MTFRVEDSAGTKVLRTLNLTRALADASRRRGALRIRDAVVTIYDDSDGVPLFQWSTNSAGVWNLVSGGFL